MADILIVYCSQYEYPMRATVRDHLHAFRRYAPHRCFHLDLGGPVPGYIGSSRFEVVVFHNTYLAGREVSAAEFDRLMMAASFVKGLPAVKVALPQDEFTHTEPLCRFINEFAIDHVFSVAPASEWPRIYEGIDFGKVTFHKVLTGYLDERTVARIASLGRGTAARPMDVGYRAGFSYAHGWHGYLKGEVARVFREAAHAEGLVTDISTREQDTFRQDAWYRFLLRCKYTLGVEGGSSVLDRDGSIRGRTREYRAAHPEASFEEVRAACYPDADGTLRLFALSPRHLEACATRTCQVLIEGAYDGVLVAGEHYIMLNRDLSNLKEVLRIVKEDRQRTAIVDRAYRDVVASGRYTYRRFVEAVLAPVLARVGGRRRSLPAQAWVSLLYEWNRLTETLTAARRAFRFYCLWPLSRNVRAWLGRLLPRRGIGCP